MARSYANKSGPSGAYSHKSWYKGAPFQLAFAAGLNSFGQALALKCGAEIDEASYLRTRYLLTCKTNEKGNIGYGAANATALSAEDARKAVGNIKPSIIKTDEEVTWRLDIPRTQMHFLRKQERHRARSSKHSFGRKRVAPLSSSRLREFPKMLVPWLIMYV